MNRTMRTALCGVGIMLLATRMSVLAVVNVGTGEVLRSTDTVLDAWRQSETWGVRYTPDIVLNGGTFILDDAVPSEFAGTVSGCGTLEIQNATNVVFRGGEGLLAGSTVHVNVTQPSTLTLGGGNVFGCADTVFVDSSLVWNAAGEDVTFAETQTLRVGGSALYARQGTTWTVLGTLDIPLSSSFADYGTFVVSGTVRTGVNKPIHIYHGVTFDLSSGTTFATDVIFEHNGNGRLVLSTDPSASNVTIRASSLSLQSTIDLAGHDCTLGAVNIGAPNIRIMNSGGTPATLSFLGETTFGGRVEPGVVLDVPGGSTFSAAGLSNNALRARDGVVTIADAGGARGLRSRYVRFIVDKFRTTSGTSAAPTWWSVVALSEFALVADGKNRPWPEGTIASQEVAFNTPTTCGPDKLIDGRTDTKHCVEMLGNGFRVVFDMGQPVSFSGYRWYTADDAPQRDPTDWTLQTSDDGQEWTTVDTVADYPTTESRKAEAAYRLLAGEEPMDALVPVGYRFSADENATLLLGAFRLTGADLTSVSNLLLNGTTLGWTPSMSTWEGNVAGEGTIDLSGEDGTVEVPFDCALPSVRFANSSTNEVTVSMGTRSRQITTLGARHLRFRVTKIRQNGGMAPNAGSVVALAEFELLRNGEKIAWPTGSAATQLVNFARPTTCDADKLIDGDVMTKHCIQMLGNGFCVQIDLGERVPFHGYRWYTADDASQRDPLSWTLEASDDGSTWTTVDTVIDNPTPEDRSAVGAVRTLHDSSATDAISDNMRLRVDGPLVVDNAHETVAGLEGSGSVVFAADGVLVVDVPEGDAAEAPVFTGMLACDGILRKTGPGVQRLTGRIACRQIIVSEGILDVRGASFAADVVVIEDGGRIVGRSGFCIVIR